METVEHVPVAIVNELIRLTQAGLVKWEPRLVPDSENFSYKSNNTNLNEKEHYLQYTTEVLGKPVYLAIIGSYPKWVSVDGEMICNVNDEYLKHYITNPIKSLCMVINDRASNDAISIPAKVWLEKLKTYKG